jgi:hypothetical protein
LPKELVKRRIKIRAVKGFKIPKLWEKTGWQQWQIDLPGMHRTPNGRPDSGEARTWCGLCKIKFLSTGG